MQREPAAEQMVELLTTAGSGRNKWRGVVAAGRWWGVGGISGEEL